VWVRVPSLAPEVQSSDRPVGLASQLNYSENGVLAYAKLKYMSIPNIKISDNVEIPQLSLGTWLVKEVSECKNAIKTALEVGYRHFDTAQIYENEQFVGEALSESSIPRDELFITTKIWNENMFWDDIEPSLDKSLEKLRTTYIDLLLLHFPVTELRRPAWHRMQDIYKSGKVKAIGVSNYTIQHLEELLNECEIKPAVNQVELHVYLQQPKLVKYCQDNGIVLEAYSPLAHGYDMKNQTLGAIAKKYNKSIAQIMIRWCIDNGFVAIPKSTHPNYIKENFEVFDFKLDEQDLRQIETLDKNLRTCWDPTHIA
jgi:diketogulonate reductase-like aldo/keto reductase